MLDTDTKRRIDTARDILVGKVPDPKSQVEQITIALIYKFMDDMDAESEELGGKRKFFTNEFARYGWAKLMDRSLGGHEMLALYGEGISKMPENPGIPPLFRDIFKNAYLPYRDPETLKAFLKIIDEFSYDHSERLGDAFEYLLSVLGSQGDAGQFRTIEKNDLPSAAAFLKTWLQSPATPDLLARHSFSEDPSALIVPKEKIAANGDYNLSGERYREGSSALTTFVVRPIGDISEEIKAGFASGQSSVDIKGVPHIRPMNITDKGQFTWDGLKQIALSEYEGREDYALRSGDVLFNNTNSKELVGKTCFIENDIHGGFSNHMTRIRVKPGLCVPNFLALLLHNAWKKGIFLKLANRWIGQAGINAAALAQLQIPLPPLEIQKEIVAEIEGYQKVINGARAVLDNYHSHIPIDPDWPMEPLSTLFATKSGTTPSRSRADYFQDGTIPWVKTLDLRDGPVRSTEEKITTQALNETHLSILTVGTVLVAMYGGFNQIGRTGVLEIEAMHNQAMTALLSTPRVSPYFLNAILVAAKDYWKTVANSTRKDPNITKTDVLNFKLPLPPLAIQRAIVAEIESEQTLVAANRELITRMEKKIQATLAHIWGEEAPVEKVDNAALVPQPNFYLNLIFLFQAKPFLVACRVICYP